MVSTKTIIVLLIFVFIIYILFFSNKKEHVIDTIIDYEKMKYYNKVSETERNTLKNQRDKLEELNKIIDKINNISSRSSTRKIEDIKYVLDNINTYNLPYYQPFAYEYDNTCEKYKLKQNLNDNTKGLGLLSVYFILNGLGNIVPNPNNDKDINDFNSNLLIRILPVYDFIFVNQNRKKKLNRNILKNAIVNNTLLKLSFEPETKETPVDIFEKNIIQNIPKLNMNNSEDKLIYTIKQIYDIFYNRNNLKLSNRDKDIVRKNLSGLVSTNKNDINEMFNEVEFNVSQALVQYANDINSMDGKVSTNINKYNKAIKASALAIMINYIKERISCV
jgi:hypothetical protein